MLNPLLRRAWQLIYRRYAIRKNVVTGPGFHVGLGSVLWAPERLVIGREVYIGRFCTVECDGQIGDYVMLANNVGLIGRYDHDHRRVGRPIRRAPWIGDAEYQGEGKGLQVVIEDDVWIGYNAVVLSGVTVGRGAIVAAGSVVTKDIPPYAIAAGNPARKVRERFTRDQIVKHELEIYGVQTGADVRTEATTRR